MKYFAKNLKLKQRINIYVITRITSISSMRIIPRQLGHRGISFIIERWRSVATLAMIFCKRGSSRGIGFLVNHCGRYTRKGHQGPRSAKLKLCRLSSRPHRRYRFFDVAFVIAKIDNGRPLLVEFPRK